MARRRRERMYRKVFEALQTWKSSLRRKPLVLKGARQVGKTWLMKKIARKCYADSVYISFDRDAEAAKVFDETKDPKVILERLSLIRGKKIAPEKTLIIFDEIQECPDALGALKYFNEEANAFHLVYKTQHFYAFAQEREIDFMVQHGESIIPVEVKSGGNKNAVSFKRYIAAHNPEVAIRLSANGYLKNGAITNVPLYFAGKIFDLLAGGQ
jgi:predicted AAA+ superfamily ATPase